MQCVVQASLEGNIARFWISGVGLGIKIVQCVVLEEKGYVVHIAKSQGCYMRTETAQCTIGRVD